MPRKTEHYRILRGKVRIEEYFCDKISDTVESIKGVNLMRIARDESLARLKANPRCGLATGSTDSEEWFESVNTTGSTAAGMGSSVYLPSREEIAAACAAFRVRDPRGSVYGGSPDYDIGVQFPTFNDLSTRRTTIPEDDRKCDCPYWGTEGKE